MQCASGNMRWRNKKEQHKEKNNEKTRRIESYADRDKENAPISYDNVAIPEVHIRNRKNK